MLIPILTNSLLGSSFANWRTLIPNSSTCSENQGRQHIWNNLMIPGIAKCELQPNSGSALQHLCRGKNPIPTLSPSYHFFLEGFCSSCTYPISQHHTEEASLSYYNKPKACSRSCSFLLTALPFSLQPGLDL